MSSQGIVALSESLVLLVQNTERLNEFRVSLGKFHLFNLDYVALLGLGLQLASE